MMRTWASGRSCTAINSVSDHDARTSQTTLIIHSLWLLILLLALGQNPGFGYPKASL